MLTNLEILPAADGDETSVVFDVSADQIQAVNYAAIYYLRWRFGGEALETEETLAMRVLVGLVDQLGRLADAGGHATIRTDPARSTLLYEAAATYVTMRDLESHQSVEERARLAILNGILDDLRELCMRLEVAETGVPR
ncbi:MAG TPA: hypothetical protein VIJ51_13340 [Solirubrobacteraceae bacterium]